MATPQFGIYVWDPYARIYKSVEGKKVDTDATRKIVAEVRRGTQGRLGTLAENLQSGKLTNLTEFSLEFKSEVKALYITTHAIARGGIEEMTFADWGQLGQSLKEQYSYINSMVRDIENANIGIKEDGEVVVRDTGIPELSDGFLNRVDMYTQSAWGARGEMENVIRDRELQLGSLERRVLGNSKENCPDCIELSARGFQPPGLLPDIGDGSICGPGCNCEFSFENKELNDLAEAFGHTQIGVEGDEPTDQPDFTLYPDEEKSLKGGPGSGNFGHSGRIGERGGSGQGGSIDSAKSRLAATPRVTIKGTPKKDGEWIKNPIPRSPAGLEDKMESALEKDILEYASGHLLAGTEGPNFLDAFGTTESVNLALLESPQSIVKADGVLHFIEDTNDKDLPISIIQFGSHMLVRDGNTRIVAAMLRGDETIKARVVYVQESSISRNSN